MATKYIGREFDVRMLGRDFRKVWESGGIKS
jgi:hypothetical protein